MVEEGIGCRLRPGCSSCVLQNFKTTLLWLYGSKMKKKKAGAGAKSNFHCHVFHGGMISNQPTFPQTQPWMISHTHIEWDRRFLSQRTLASTPNNQRTLLFFTNLPPCCLSPSVLQLTLYSMADGRLVGQLVAQSRSPASAWPAPNHVRGISWQNADDTTWSTWYKMLQNDKTWRTNLHWLASTPAFVISWKKWWGWQSPTVPPASRWLQVICAAAEDHNLGIWCFGHT